MCLSKSRGWSISAENNIQGSRKFIIPVSEQPEQGESQGGGTEAMPSF